MDSKSEILKKQDKMKIIFGSTFYEKEKRDNGLTYSGEWIHRYDRIYEIEIKLPENMQFLKHYRCAYHMGWDSPIFNEFDKEMYEFRTVLRKMINENNNINCLFNQKTIIYDETHAWDGWCDFYGKLDHTKSREFMDDIKNRYKDDKMYVFFDTFQQTNHEYYLNG